ncbi:MAG: hypothetical protein DRQ54_05685 [Gammaproteobacteria bacterium]|nr:MAG: hypothetical protein DRQ54_05685 [Gammaproteobacteria bacterium]
MAGSLTHTESLTITALKAMPDTSYTLLAKINHKSQYTDSLELKTKNGLLDGAIGYSQDMTGQIIAQSLGLLALKTGRSAEFGSLEMTEETECTPTESRIEVRATIDPDDSGERADLNRRLKPACLCIAINPPLNRGLPEIYGKKDGWKNASFDGLVYSTPGDYEFDIIRYQTSERTIESSVRLRTEHISLVQGGLAAVIPLDRGTLAKNEYDIVFSEGVLVKSKSIQPSESLAAIMIIPNALREVFAIPTELIQLKFDYSSSSEKLLASEKALMTTQMEIDALQAIIDAQ